MQTDVFLIGPNGQVQIFWVSNGGAWSGPLGLGPEGFAPPGAPVAACRQVLLPQTDVFVVDNAGQLQVFWVTGLGGWSGPLAIGPPGLAPPGAGLAASQQFGAGGRTDVFVVDTTGQLQVFSVVGAGAWSGPLAVGPAGFAPPGAPVAVAPQPLPGGQAPSETYVFVNDTAGSVQAFSSGGGGNWSPPEAIGQGLPGAPLATFGQTGLTQLDVFVVDQVGQPVVAWVDGQGNWSSGVPVGPAGFAPPGAGIAASQQFFIAQTDVFAVDKSGRLNVFWVSGAGAWQGPLAIGPPDLALPGAPVTASEQFGMSEQTDVFVVDKSGQLQVFWVTGGGAWQGPSHIGPAGAPGVSVHLAASEQFLVPPRLQMLNATAIKPTSATLNGSVTMFGDLGHCAFRYGTPTPYTYQTPAVTVQGFDATPVTRTLTGLQPDTTYHFLMALMTTGGSYETAERTFTTATPAPPPQVVVPNIVGLRMDVAYSTLHQQQLDFGFVANATGEIREDHLKITAQGTPPGTRVAPGTTINVAVALWDQTGFSAVKVHNEAADSSTCTLYLYDFANGRYANEGTVSFGGSLEIQLADQHSQLVIAVDTNLLGCPGNDPSNVDCQRLVTGAYGKAAGPVAQVTIV